MLCVSSRSSIGLAAAVAFAVPFAANPVAGQASIAGRVVDSQSGRSIAGVAVTGVSINRTTITNEAGLFLLDSLILGTVVLRFESIGYVARTDSITIDDYRSVAVEVRLSRDPINLPPIAVTVRSQRLVEVGFYERRFESGLSGHFLTRTDIEKRSPRGLTDLFYNIPGAGVSYGGPGRRVIRFRRFPGNVGAASPGGCVPDLYLDGFLLQDVSARDNPYTPRLRDYDVVATNAIEGIEVYVGSVTPMQYHHVCGVILIWTRR